MEDASKVSVQIAYPCENCTDGSTQNPLWTELWQVWKSMTEDQRRGAWVEAGTPNIESTSARPPASWVLEMLGEEDLPPESLPCPECHGARYITKAVGLLELHLLMERALLGERFRR